jgi:type I restriction enzyme R subunit
METPSFQEDHISQIPAIKLLMNLGWQYLSPTEALEARSGRSSNVLLESILKEQLQKINSIQYKGKEFPFSESKINAAIIALRDLPEQDGFISANQHFYDLITLGKSFEQTILGDKKSFSFQYIDWKTLENNVFHVTEEFSVLRSDRKDYYRPDIILFINGIPMVVIECKSPREKEPINKAIEQHASNQQMDGIRGLYLYSNLLISLAVNEAKYATTASTKEFWSFWREIFQSKQIENEYINKLHILKNKEIGFSEQTASFHAMWTMQVRTLHATFLYSEQIISEQDKL